MTKYQEIRSIEPVLVDCFFAFSKSQFEEGIKKLNLEGKKIYSGIGGLYGTHEGIAQLYKFYDDQTKQIAEQCEPQDVYNYEFNNHECCYTNDDEEAIKIIVNTFGIERAKTVKRKFGYYSII